MFVTDSNGSNYDIVYRDLLNLWNKNHQKEISVNFFNQSYHVMEDGIYFKKKAIDAVGGILILRYLIKTYDKGLYNEWIPYRAFRDGANFSSYIKNKIEDQISDCI